MTSTKVSGTILASMCFLCLLATSTEGGGGRGGGVFGGRADNRGEREGLFHRHEGGGGLFGRMEERRQQKLADIEARIGPERMERRIRFWNNFSTFANGLASGMDSAASYQPSTGHGYGPQPLPGSHQSYYHTLQQLEWEAFNRTYSTNPDHAPVR